MKKTFAKIILVTILLTSLSMSAFAEDTTTSQNTSNKNSAEDEQKTLKGHQFDLGILDTDYGTENKTDSQKQSYFKSDNPIVSFLLSIIQFATLIIGSLAIIILIIGGFMLVTSQGNQQQLDSGKKTIKYAIIGLVVTFLSYVIVTSVQSLFITEEISTNQESSTGTTEGSGIRGDQPGQNPQDLPTTPGTPEIPYNESSAA